MISKLLCTDVLAIRCVNNLVFVGVGCTLHIFDIDTYKLEKKIDCLYPYNIHGIIEGPNNKISIFGANSLCGYNIQKKQETLIVKEEFSKNCLNDWIITVKWLSFDGYEYLAVLLAHNNVCIYDCIKKNYQNVWCKEKCILYGGSMLVQNQKDLIIFSGTVYQEILIWEINYSSSCTEISPILHRLHGHNGVIFSVIYDSVTQLICSTSDDRTVRLWEVNSNETNKNHIIWKDVKIKLKKTMFGHTARVWKSIIRNETLITIGEDSLMCTWSLDGKLINKICAHHGAAIWSIDISSDNKSIFTGGADGAVHAWPFPSDYIQPITLVPRQHISILPKYNCYLKSGNFLIFNENGILYIYDRWQSNPKEFLYLERFNTYCIMQVSLCHSYVCFASKDGYIAIYKEADITTNKILQLIVEEKIMESQILSIQWLGNNNLVACGLNGVLKIFSFTMEGSVTIQSMGLLPQCRERWLTAAILYEHVLICGDRAGNMHVFEVQKYNSNDETNILKINNKPIQTFPKVHGKIGIQNFIVLHSKLISGGRDGTLRFYEITEHQNTKSLCTLHSEKMPMDWISGSLKVSDDIFILGFKETEFLVYSMFYRRIVTRVPCGGGHRSWDCIVLNELVSFLYIRNKQVYIFDFPLAALKTPVLLNGFHTKEVNFINPVLNTNMQNVFISGGEDEPETRYMDAEIYHSTTSLHCVLLFVACADGFVRIFLYNTKTKRISLKIHAKCAIRCIVKTTVLTYEEKVIALTMSTDGIIRFIDFTDIVLKIIQEPHCEKQEFQNYIDVSVAKFNLHQSGINSYDLKAIGKDEYLLATGGDDNLFNIIRFKIETSGKDQQLYVSLLSKWCTSTTHFAQITGVKFYEDKIFSVGMDQQVIMYNYSFNNDCLCVTVLKKIFTFVTDVKGLTLCYNSKDKPFLCVYGRGFEILTYE
ncbi:tRNA (34-2'-O)-methyltransferase regulator WDR6 isoform X3 [Megachile rotundata]|uniref:tRNA (34-2'-O)-methyltransferase regulator WDR6 isoform X3 n=1 Tax=Megachile rotundata TaxID=143995 RepID=UPI0006149F17|nr:PREDICTED: WD repeat-containing protein 6 isoform X2 [Megachile rotundata]